MSLGPGNVDWLNRRKVRAPERFSLLEFLDMFVKVEQLNGLELAEWPIYGHGETVGTQGLRMGGLSLGWGMNQG